MKTEADLKFEIRDSQFQVGELRPVTKVISAAEHGDFAAALVALIDLIAEKDFESAHHVAEEIAHGTRVRVLNELNHQDTKAPSKERFS